MKQVSFKVGNERLLKLADHLEHGKLGHDKFNFSYLHASFECGTIGCALGECPTVWPEQWVLDIVPRLINTAFDIFDAFENARIFFNLGYGAAQHLFAPDFQDIEVYGGRELRINATKEEVAANIREFVKRRQEKN